jgi:hypothetical protein
MEPLFGQRGTFDEVFPNIEAIRVEVEERGAGAGGYSKSVTTVYEEDTLPGERITCSNPKCRNGGLLLRKVLDRMVRENITQLSISEICNGKEKSGRRFFQDCINGFEVKVSFNYKETHQR